MNTSRALQLDRLSTPKGRVLEAAAVIRRSEAELLEARERMPRFVRQAHKAGATIPQLIEWTGYSRRTIYYLLEETK